MVYSGVQKIGMWHTCINDLRKTSTDWFLSTKIFNYKE